MKRCEQPVPLSPSPCPRSSPPPPHPILVATSLARSASSRAAERSDCQYLAITKYEFTFNNCGKHRRTRRVATGGESDEIRSRPREPAWDKFRFTPPPLCSLRLSPSYYERYTLIIIDEMCCCTLLAISPNLPLPINPCAFLSHLIACPIF